VKSGHALHKEREVNKMRITKCRVVAVSLMICLFPNIHILNNTDSGHSECTDWLGDINRTAYSPNNGPDMPIVLWKRNIPGDFDTSPFIVDNKVLILWKDSMYHLSRTKVFLFDLLTGETSYEADPHLIFQVFPAEDRIFGIGGDTLNEIDLDTGQTHFLASIPEKGFYRLFNIYPLVLEDSLIIPCVPAICLSRSDFHVVWNLNDTISDPDLEPFSLAGDESLTLFIMRKDGMRLLAVDTQTGTLKWETSPLHWARWLSLKDNTIYCGGKNLWAFNRDGTQRWVFFPEGYITSNLVLGPDAVYFVDEEDNLYKVDFNGNLIWKTKWEASLEYYETHLIGAGDILYCIGNYGDSYITRSSIVAFNMEDGSRLWNLDLASPFYVRAPPAIGDGILVIGKVGGEVLALASDPDIFVERGNSFLLKGEEDQAITSFKKAAELYEKKGDISKSQEIQERILEIETPSGTPPPETTPPETTPPETTPPETTPPETTPPETTPDTPLLIMILIGALIGIFILSYFFIQKKRTG
jgi:outer membrane protein assembly factor BamB